MAWLPLAALLLATVASGPPAAETSAERFHRKGVHCMDVIERPQCAIDNFEALLRENTRQRELLTDGLLRLIRLYRQTDRDDEIGPLLRGFWDAGGGRRSRGQVSYSARYLPKTMDILFNVDPPRMLESSLLERAGALTRDALFTCDPVRRHDVEVEMRWRRAAAQAAAEGRETSAVFYEQLDAQQARQREYEAQREAARRRGYRETTPPPAPLAFELACPLAEALALTDNRDWRRITGAGRHDAPARSVAMFQLPGLDARLADAVDAGRLVSTRPGRWRLPEPSADGDRGDNRGEGAPAIELAVLDRDELVAAPAPLLDAMVAASRRRKRTMSRELDRLVGKIPRDTSMFMVVTADALHNLSVGRMERGALRRTLEAILPRPRGLQIAAVTGDALAIFTRVPTDTAMRGRMLVNLVNLVLTRSADEDPEAAKMLENLDVAEASDRKALLASYVVTAAQLEAMFWD